MVGKREPRPERSAEAYCSRRGFTIVELVITITIFAMAMAALLVGLRTGIRTWRTVRAHQVREAENGRLAGRISEDLRQVMAIIKDTPPLVGTKGEDGFDTVTITALASRREQRVGTGADWAIVKYQVIRNDTSKATDLVRTTQQMVAQSPVGTRVEERLLAGVTAVKFEYLTDDGPIETWSNATQPPPFVRATCWRASGAPFTQTFWIPAGSLVKGTS